MDPAIAGAAGPLVVLPVIETVGQDVVSLIAVGDGTRLVMVFRLDLLQVLLVLFWWLVVSIPISSLGPINELTS